MFRTKVTDVDGKTLRHLIRNTDICPALLPGGFSEAVYVGADPVLEHCFIEGRKGMFRIAIEEGVDIIPQVSNTLPLHISVEDSQTPCDHHHHHHHHTFLNYQSHPFVLYKVHVRVE
jgi:hypothetical protein